MKNNMTGVVAKMTEHATERWKERASENCDLESEFMNAVPFGVQFDSDLMLLAPSEMVFVVKRNFPLSSVITVLTKQQSFGNMQASVKQTRHVDLTCESLAIKKKRPLKVFFVDQKSERESARSSAAEAYAQGERLLTQYDEDNKKRTLNEMNYGGAYRKAYISMHRRLLAEGNKEGNHEAGK